MLDAGNSASDDRRFSGTVVAEHAIDRVQIDPFRIKRPAELGEHAPVGIRLADVPDLDRMTRVVQNKKALRPTGSSEDRINAASQLGMNKDEI
jgi:hypothetical protein